MAAANPNASGRAALGLAQELGFALAGVAPAAPTAHEQAYRRWVATGRHGEMDYLERYVEQRLDPRAMVPGAASVLCVADRYPFPGQNVELHHGRVAGYARGDDYHKVIKKRLHKLADALIAKHPDHTFRSAVDTAPVLEREHAARAGVGWTGKHTLTIHPTAGSYLLLGEIITTLPLTAPPEPPETPETPAPPEDSLAAARKHSSAAALPGLPIADHCGTCTRCIDACPTRCIDPAGYALDATRCISYLTLEHRGRINPELFESMSDWIAGCDVCQDVCPHNAKAQERAQRDELPATLEPYEPRNGAFDLLEMLSWSEDDRRAAFRGSALKRMKLPMVQRNALIAAGNALADGDHPPLRQRIEQLASDEDAAALVRNTARDVLAALNKKTHQQNT